MRCMGGHVVVVVLVVGLGLIAPGLAVARYHSPRHPPISMALVMPTGLHRSWQTLTAGDGVKAEESSWAFYLPVHAPADSPCGAAVTDVIGTLTSPTNATSHATKMADSWGKVPDGFLYGDPWTVGLGVYDQCVRLRSPNDPALDGRYCFITFGKSPTVLGGRGGVGAGARLAPASATVFQPSFGSVSYGTCVPASCTQDQVQESLSITLNHTDRILFSVDCQTLDNEEQFTAADIAMISFLVVVLSLVAAATGADLLCRGSLLQHQGVAICYLLPFSAYTNLGKLFHISTKQRPGVITCLHGMRVLSMTWVIYGHQYIMSLTLVQNFMHLGQRVSGFWFQVISNADLATDSFFYLSGLVVALGLLQEVHRAGTFNAFKYYLHRFLRLTPSIALVSLFLATLYRHLLTGPYAPSYAYLRQVCSSYWWRDAFFMDNLWTTDGNGLPVECLGQCWYTAADTQMYLVAPLLLLPLAFYPTKGEMLLFVASLTSVVVPAAIIYTHDYPPAYLLTLDPSVDNDGYERDVYKTPWCRVGAYVVGIWTGHVIFNRRELPMNPWQVVAGWSVASCSGVAVLFGMVGYSRPGPDALPFDPVTQVLYGGLHRAVWCAALAWVVLACHYGYGGPVAKFLSYPPWQPLSRLTYTTYLVSLPVQLFVVYTTRDLGYFTHANKVIETCGAVFLSIMVAIPVTLVVEAPVRALEKLILARPDHTQASLPTTPLQPGDQTNPTFTRMDEDVKALSVAADQPGDQTNPTFTCMDEDVKALSVAVEEQEMEIKEQHSPAVLGQSSNSGPSNI